MRKAASVVMLTLLLISMSTLTFHIHLVEADTITVPDDYATIQEAVNPTNNEITKPATIDASRQATDDYIWVASFGPDNLNNYGLPGRYVGTDDPYNGFGVPYWTGNFSLSSPIVSVNSITVHALPFTQGEYMYTLSEDVDFVVHPDDDLVELLTPLDVPIMNEHWKDGVNISLSGWASINYVASGIESVWVDMNNGTARFGRNWGYAACHPSEWWYGPEWSWELTLLQLLDYCYECPWDWPPGSEWWINYTAASYLTVDYTKDATFVGGFTVSFDNSILMQSYIGAVSAIIVGTVIIAICVERVKRRKERG